MFRPFSAAFLLMLLSAAPSWADEIKLLNGKSVTGTLEKISDTEVIVGGVSSPLSQVLDVMLRPGRSAPAVEKYLEVQLIDDSILRCSKVVFGANEWRLELTSGAIVKVPNSAVVSFLRDAQDLGIKKQWAKMMKSKTRNDRIFVLSTGDLNPIEGVLRDISEKDESIKFKREGKEEIDLKLDRLHGLSFVRTDAPAVASLCKVIDLDGNILVASKLAFDGKQIAIATPLGTNITLDPKLIARLDFNFGRLIYLSDLTATISDSPLLGGFSALRKDANLDGAPIMLMDRQYPKGLSMYAGVELNYDLGGKYKEFKALLGADARIAEEGQGVVTVTIYCDQEKRFSEVVSTKSAKTLAINVKDVSSLRIIVSGPNFTNYAGHATLANAHVSQ